MPTEKPFNSGARNGFVEGMYNAAGAGLLAAGIAGASYAYEHTHEYLPTSEQMGVFDPADEVDTSPPLEHPAK